MAAKQSVPEIIFEDGNIVIVNKPSGLLTIPDRYDTDEPNLTAILNEKYGKIYTVHRLDKDTSGIMVFAKDAASHRDLSIKFQEQQVQKIYHAVVKGVFPQDEMEIDIPILPDPSRKGLSIPSARGKESLSVVKVLTRFTSSTLVEVDLVTGRHHQLRVHMAAVGYPLLVDAAYGGDPAFLVSSVKRKFNLKKHTDERPVISRLSMHAYSLTFLHPATGEPVGVVADYPKDFRAMLSILEKYSVRKGTYHD